MERGELPQKVTITVISGRQLQGRRKGEPIRASVVFGLGKELFQTEEVESSQPFWNQEAHVNVSGRVSDMLKFKLKDQGHTVGIITLPISSLTKRKHEQWIPFQPYKKDRTYHGDLCLNCYVSEVRTSADLSPTNSYNSSSEDVSGGGGGWKALGATFEKWSPLGGKLGGGGGRAASSSDSDIRRDLYGGGHLSPIDDERMGSPLEDDTSQLPDVSGISPSEGSTEGNERIILRGTNLGESKDDIVKVLLVDIDCTKTLEYYSSGKLAITSLPRDAPTSGPVVVETVSGGTGVSSVHFTYTSKSTKPDIHVHVLGGASSTGGGQKKQRLSDQEIDDLQAENKSLKKQLKELKEAHADMSEELTSLRSYLERLLSTIITNKPELLELAKE